jgi:archaellum component FlaC
MSNSKSAIQEIKNLMVQFGFMSEDKTLLSFKLEDETILNTEKLEAGSKIYKINEAFEQVSLEDGTYKLKENFELEVAESQIVSVKEIFVDAKLVDGTAIKVSGDGLVEGAKVTVVTAEGEIPAPDGVHELEDGTKVETKDGIIAKIEEVVAKAEGEVPEMEKPEVEVSIPVGGEEEMIQLVKEFVSKMGEKIKKMEEQMSSLSTDFNSFKKEPAAKKIADGKTEKFNKVDDYMDSKLEAIAALRKTNK